MLQTRQRKWSSTKNKVWQPRALIIFITYMWIHVHLRVGHTRSMCRSGDPTLSPCIMHTTEHTCSSYIHVCLHYIYIGWTHSITYNYIYMLNRLCSCADWYSQYIVYVSFNIFWQNSRNFQHYFKEYVEFRINQSNSTQ